VQPKETNTQFHDYFSSGLFLGCTPSIYFTHPKLRNTQNRTNFLVDNRTSLYWIIYPNTGRVRLHNIVSKIERLEIFDKMMKQVYTGSLNCRKETHSALPSHLTLTLPSLSQLQNGARTQVGCCAMLSIACLTTPCPDTLKAFTLSTYSRCISWVLG
jgi:hypothetical protein